MPPTTKPIRLPSQRLFEVVGTLKAPTTWEDNLLRLKPSQYQQHNYYHLYNRGAHRQSIFREPDNYLFVLKRIKQYARKLKLSIIAYCLLPNHYHLLVRQDDVHKTNLLPQRVFNSYTKAYNKRYGHSGTLFEGSFKAKEINHQAYLLQLCQYIHANPIKHGLVDNIDEWPYSNYLEWVNQRNGTLVDYDFIETHFSSPHEYAKAIKQYLVSRKLSSNLDEYLRGLE